MRPIALGIDLGTTFTSTAVYDPLTGRPQIVPNSDGDRLTPSAVWMDDEGVLQAGEEALARACRTPERVKRWVKYEMGSVRRLTVGGRQFLPEQLSAVMLGRAVEDVGRYLGEPVREAVITVPAYFDEPARAATQSAGFLAGLESVRLLNEPTASGLCFGLERRDGERFLVFDLGGGTVDISVMRASGGELEVLAVAGDRHLGGTDFDAVLAERLAARCAELHGVRPTLDDPAGAADWHELMQEAEAAKKKLSIVSSVQAGVRVGGVRADLIVTRAEFELLIARYLERIEELLAQVMEDAAVRPQDLDALLLAGGSTRVPAVLRTLRTAVPGLEPMNGINPDEVVALGAAVGAHLVTGESVGRLRTYRDVNALPFGVLVKDAETGAVYNEVLIPRNTPLPHRVEDTFFTIERGQRQVVARVTQGEGRDASQVRVVGVTELELPPEREAGQPIDVVYRYDGEGRIHCDFVDRASGRAAAVEHDIAAEPDASDAPESGRELEAGA